MILPALQRCLWAFFLLATFYGEANTLGQEPPDRNNL